MYFSFIHIIFNNLITRHVLSSFLLHIKYEKHQRQYLKSVSSKYRVDPESKKSNVNDILD